MPKTKIFQKAGELVLRNKKKMLLVFLFLFVSVIAGMLYFFKGAPPKYYPPIPQYTKAYSLVSDKISQSATIAINLPPNVEVNREEAKKSVEFFPQIKGEWLDSEEIDRIIFKPLERMKTGRYYAVILKIEDKNIGGDFLVVEDPKVEAVFPKNDSEANEKSEITVMFNRPMVPLSTLDVMYGEDIPVEITPQTKGKFKWIGTQTLQFIPEERLIRSSNYLVKVKPDFVSMDGLEIGGFEHKFRTRILRYEFLSQGSAIYNKPIEIRFNQPVDLEKTSKEMALWNASENKQVEFLAEYGTRNVYDEKTKKSEKVAEPSIILVYNKTDKHNREKLWNFTENYRLKINKAYPQEGDIVLEKVREANILVTDIISGINAESKRSNFSTPDFFDPEGKLWIEFFEEIDLNKSRISADKLEKIGYGEKCNPPTPLVGGASEEEYIETSEEECEKITNRKKIYLTFASGRVGASEKLSIKLEEIYNFSGLKINVQPIIKETKAIPDLSVIRTIPEENSSGSDLSEFVICSNSPIKAIGKDDISSYIKTNPEFEFGYWQEAILVPRNADGNYYECQKGEFESRIYYGLMPERDYDVEIKAADHFGREINIKRNFKSGKMPSRNLNFYHLQNRYSVSSPAKTKLTFAATNMDYINLNICKLDAKNMLDNVANGIFYTQSPTIGKCQKTVNRKLDLAKKYWVKNYFKVDLKDYFADPIGHYVLTFSHPDYRENWGERKERYERTAITITNLAAAEKKVVLRDDNYIPADEKLSDKQKEKLKNVYWITYIGSMEPVSGARISVLERKEDRSLKEAVSFISNDNGIAETEVLKNIGGVIVSKGKDSAIILSSDYESSLQYGKTARQAQKIYLYSDKPIYKPGQEVYIKGLYRIGYDGDYEIFRDKKVPVRIVNSKEEEMFNQELEVSEFGTFQTKIVLDSKSPLGKYRIEAKNNSAYFEVEEYVPAPFKVEVKSDKEEYISKDAINLDVSADYYFGVPLEGGEVEYSIVSQNYYFDKYQDEYFNFGSSWYYCYDYCDYGDKFIARGKVALSENGKAKISYEADLDGIFKKEEDRKSKIFAVYVTAKNTNGQAVTSQKSFIVHRGEYYLGVKSDKYFLGKNEKFNVKVKSVDTLGKNIEARNLDLKIGKVKWAQSKRKEVDGGYYNNWERKIETVEGRKINTDRGGNWNGDFALKEEGEYEITVEGLDGRGNKIKTSYDVYIYGEAHVDIRRNNDNSLEMAANKTSFKTGEKGEIIIKSPFNKSKALISIERGKIFDYKIVDINQSLYKYSFDVLPAYIPNFFVSAILISPDPEVKFGKLDFQVDTENNRLDISAKSNKTSYLPGEEVALDFEAKDYLSAAVEAEFSVAVVDLSVLALKGNPKKNPLVFFYGGFPLAISTSSNLKNILYEIDVPTEGKGGGGLEAEDLAKKKRGEFRDTAFWVGQIKTDKNGKAQVKFKLPDNLTTWQVEAVGITKDTKLGAAYKEFLARKDLMVVPIKPRFAIPGDKFSIGAKIFNQTKDSQKLEASFSSSTLHIADNQSKITIEIKPEESKTIYFEVLSDLQKRDGEHQFILSAKNNRYEDTVENSIKITRNNTYETTATSSYSESEIVNEFVYLPESIEKDRGELSVKHSATLAVFISDALNYLLSYPYGCSEQIASKLEAIAVVKKGLNLENIGDKFSIKNVEFEGRTYTLDELVEIGLAKLYANQKSDGGFGYYAESQADYYLTLHVASVLKDLKDAGYKINEESLKRSFQYINSKISYDQELQKNKDLVILTFYHLGQLKEYGKPNDNLVNYIKSLSKEDAFLNEKISNTSLATLAIILSENGNTFSAAYKEKVFNILENRIDIDSRGAFLPAGKNILWRYYATPVKDTALLLKALTSAEKDNAILDKILRWILKSRSKDGSWGSTNNSITVMDALIDYINWQKENKSEFKLQVLLNEEEKQSFDYKPENILDQNSFEIPVGNLKFGSLNSLKFMKESHNELKNNFYYDIALKYYLPIDQIPPQSEGFTIERGFYSMSDRENKNPLKEAKVGDVLRGHLKVFVPAQRNFAAIEDFIPAGVELINFNLSTEDRSLQIEGGGENVYRERWDWWNDPDYGRRLDPDAQELHDDRLFLFKENLPAGEYEFDYYVRVLTPGKFHHLPAVVSEMYFPENFARTRGNYFEVK